MPEGNEQQQQKEQQVGQQQMGEAQPPTFDEWLAAQDEQARGLYEQHVAGLKKALASERDQRQELAKQLREAARGAEAGSQLKKDLEAAATRAEEAERKAAFFEEATRPEVGCTNARLALLGALEIDAIDKRGRIDWEAMRQHFPELFKAKAAAAGNAGAGTGGQPPTVKADMNTFIRRSAGRE